MSEDEAEFVLLTREEAAQVFGVSVATIDRWIDDGGDAFVVEWGGKGRPYQIDAVKLRAWREHRLAEDDERARRHQELVAQMELSLTGGQATDGTATLTAQQRAQVWSEQLLHDKLRRQRGELCEIAKAEAVHEARLQFVASWCAGLPDVLARKLNWDSETIAEFAGTLEQLQEFLAREMMSRRFMAEITDGGAADALRT